MRIVTLSTAVTISPEGPEKDLVTLSNSTAKSLPCEFPALLDPAIGFCSFGVRLVKIAKKVGEVNWLKTRDENDCEV
jgi:hypothetical protein